MRYVEFSILLEYDRSKTIAAMGAALTARAERDSVDVDSVIDAAEQSDPTKNKQYVVWILRQYIKNNLSLADMQSVGDNLRVFFTTKGQHKRLGIDSDINRLDWRSLDTVAKKLSSTEINTDEPASDASIPDAKILYNGPLGILAIPQTEAASCELGSGTKWCTAAKDNNMFDNYSRAGDLYIWHDKKEKQKYQFHFERGEFRDAQDERVDGDTMHYLTSINPVTKKLFKLKAPSVIKSYVDYLKFDPEEDEEYEDESSILDVDIVTLVNSLDFDSAVKIIKPAAMNHDKDDYALLDALIRRFQSKGEIDTVLEKHNKVSSFTNFSYEYKNYKLRRAPEAEAIQYMLDNKDEEGMADHALRYASKLGKRMPELEEIIIRNPKTAYLYAYHNLKQQPWPEAEKIIATNPWSAAYYAVKVLQKRWPAAEETIRSSPGTWRDYAKAFDISD